MPSLKSTAWTRLCCVPRSLRSAVAQRSSQATILHGYEQRGKKLKLTSDFLLPQSHNSAHFCCLIFWPSLASLQSFRDVGGFPLPWYVGAPASQAKAGRKMPCRPSRAHMTEAGHCRSPTPSSHQAPSWKTCRRKAGILRPRSSSVKSPEPALKRR